MKASHPYHVIISPVLSEESNIQTESKGKYTFRVNREANKNQIKQAIEEQWPNVQVVSVNTMNYAGKRRNRRLRGGGGVRSAWKKAIVTLREGDSIDLL